MYTDRLNFRVGPLLEFLKMNRRLESNLKLFRDAIPVFTFLTARSPLPERTGFQVESESPA